jgi:hypothetical protein
MQDPDERVRQLICKTMADMPAEAAKRLSKEAVTALMDRCLDKKVAVRTTAITACGTVFLRVLGRTFLRADAVLDDDVVQLMGVLPAKILALSLHVRRRGARAARAAAARRSRCPQRTTTRSARRASACCSKT